MLIISFIGVLMPEYIILIMILVLLIFSFIYIIKAIKSSQIEDLITQGNYSIQKENNTSLNQELLIKNNLDELEFDFKSEKLAQEDYDSLKETMLKEINSINKITDDNLQKNEVENNIKILICKSCKKELETDSKFCKFCGEKIIS
jgi:hypothetical protein